MHMDSLALEFISKHLKSCVPIESKDYEEEFVIYYNKKYKRLCRVESSWYILPDALKFISPWEAIAYIAQKEKLS